MFASAAARTSDLLLKVTAPRMPRDLLPRALPSTGGESVWERPVVLVQAPAGFGKTSLVAQWRLNQLARGAAVAWVSAHAADGPDRLVQALALAVRVGAGRPTFGHVLLEAPAAQGLEAFTIWLAEVAQGAFELALVVDEADRLPEASREGLAYVMRNAPPNLRVIVAARAGSDMGLEDLVAYGHCTLIGAAQLRFTLEETLELARRRQGGAFDRDRAARLHERMEGWPLGIQLALALPPGTSGLDVPGLQAPAGSMHAQVIALLLGTLAPADLGFLTRISMLQNVHPALCRALLPESGTVERLERLVRDTPLFVTGGFQGWLRMHSLAREALRQRFDALPLEERTALHGQACEWLAAEDLLEAAASHALASGQRDRAYDLAESSLYDSVVAQGRQALVLDWIGRLPPDELMRRPRLVLAAAWSLALGERHDEACRLVEGVLERAGAGADDALRCECSLILGAAAVFADDPDRFAQFHDPWADQPPLRTQALLQVHANRSAFRALLAGEPALARLRQQRSPRQAGAGNLDRWGEFIIALAYWHEGQPLMVEQLLAPCLAIADNDLGRRSPFATMAAAVLAAARCELGEPERAAALLADRLDVLERTGLPVAVLLAFRSLARIAAAAGHEQQALDMLGALDAVGIARKLPRLRLASLGEQVRLHAHQYRASTCRDLARQLEELEAAVAGEAAAGRPLWRRSVEGIRLLARAHAAIAERDWRGAREPLQQAQALAAQAHRGRDHIEAMGLRAWVLDRSSERSQDLLREATNLAAAACLKRVFEDAHPDLGAWVRDSAGARAQAPATVLAVAPQRAAPAPRAMASAALTPKEGQVLELLARNLSNKEIALAMQVGEETIKWHVKNLFAKLDAGTRKQVVGRARILGLLSESG